LQEAFSGYQTIIDKFKQKEEHTLSEMYFCSQAYYRISQLLLQLKFLQKAESYMNAYEILQDNYLRELKNADQSVEAKVKQEFLANQL